MWLPQTSRAFPSPLVTKNEKCLLTKDSKDTLTYNSSKNTLGVSIDSCAIKCRQKLKIKRELHKKNKIHRSFSIKYLNKITINETMKSKTTALARIFDHALPIDATFSKPFDADTCYIHPILGSLCSLKRITSIVYDLELDEYKYKLDNRSVSNIVTSGTNQKFSNVNDILTILKNSNQDYSTQLYL